MIFLLPAKRTECYTVRQREFLNSNTKTIKTYWWDLGVVETTKYPKLFYNLYLQKNYRTPFRLCSCLPVLCTKHLVWFCSVFLFICQSSLREFCSSVRAVLILHLKISDFLIRRLNLAPQKCLWYVLCLCFVDIHLTFCGKQWCSLRVTLYPYTIN